MHAIQFSLRPKGVSCGQHGGFVPIGCVWTWRISQVNKTYVLVNIYNKEREFASEDLAQVKLGRIT